jgi:16S rRNA C1402 N4-methylase RsmH
MVRIECVPNFSKKPLVPGDEELDTNARSRSAKLRAARRAAPECEDTE